MPSLMDRSPDEVTIGSGFGRGWQLTGCPLGRRTAKIVRR